MAAACALCVACNPKLTAPAIETPKEYIFGQGFNRDTANVDLAWWRIFGDTVLNRLVERALERNKDLQVAVSRIDEARSNLKVARATYLPDVGLSINAGYSYDVNGSGSDQTYAIEPTISWEIPLFGALRHTTISARAKVSYSEWHYRGVYLALAAEVATTYFTLLQYRQDLSIARRSAELRAEMVALVKSMSEYGFASGTDYQQALSLLYTARADVPLYERAIRQTTLSLGALMGDAPELLDTLGVGSVLMSDYRPYDIPIAAPSDLLHRRPDLLQSYYAMREAGAAVGLARSARFPSVSLPLSGGVSTGDITKLFANGSWVASAMLSIAQPIYNFGRLKRQEMVAREAYKQSLLAYEQCYIEALADVESALVAISTYRAQIARYAKYVEANQRIAQMNYALYKSGMSDYLSVIDAERELYASRMQFENLVAQQYINYVTLCKALGGGWQ